MSTTPWPNFTRAELVCRCGCGRMEMDEAFMYWIQDLRVSLGFPFPISSAYRCPNHNRRVSTTGTDGPHTTGLAIDIAVSGSQAHALLKAAMQSGYFTGIGLKQSGPPSGRFIHLDMLDSRVHSRPRPWIWTY